MFISEIWTSGSAEKALNKEDCEIRHILRRWCDCNKNNKWQEMIKDEIRVGFKKDSKSMCNRDMECSKLKM
jgi:hypothetical protein